ncbi:hypothetical protein [Streptomyces sp. NPDC054783]
MPGRRGQPARHRRSPAGFGDRVSTGLLDVTSDAALESARFRAVCADFEVRLT